MSSRLQVVDRGKSHQGAHGPCRLSPSDGWRSAHTGMVVAVLALTLIAATVWQAVIPAVARGVHVGAPRKWHRPAVQGSTASLDGIAPREPRIQAPNVEFVRIADLDADGDADFVALERATANDPPQFSFANFHWYENLGQGASFAAARLIQQFRNGCPELATPADLDDDGWTDVVALVRDDCAAPTLSIAWAQNNRDRTFEPLATLRYADGRVVDDRPARDTTFIEAADIDGDGWEDLLTVDQTDPRLFRVHWWRNTRDSGAPRFERFLAAESATQPPDVDMSGTIRLDAADIDQDGLTDFVAIVGTYHPAPKQDVGKIWWWRNEASADPRFGGHRFAWQPEVGEQPNLQDVAATDYDQDGSVDVLALSRRGRGEASTAASSQVVLWRWSKPCGRFVPDPEPLADTERDIVNPPVPADGGAWQSLDKGDIDQDPHGAPDFVLAEPLEAQDGAGPGEGMLAWYRNAVAAATPTPLPTTTRTPTVPATPAMGTVTFEWCSDPSANCPPVLIPQNGNRTFTIEVPQGVCSGPIKSLDVGLFIEHTWRGDLTVLMKAPTTFQQEILFENLDGSSDHIGGHVAGKLEDLILDDEARTEVEAGDCGSSGSDDLCYGHFKSLAQALRFNYYNKTAAGTWEMEVQDGFHQDKGNLVHWKLIITCPLLPTPAPTEEPVPSDTPVPPTPVICPTLIPTPTVATPTRTPTPTLTPSRTPTQTATPTATVTPSPTPTATATATATRRPQPAYIPIALKDLGCPPISLYAEIVLVIDASTSMDEPTAAGRTKLAAAVEAAATFIDGLRLQAGGDRVAIVTFNDDALVQQSLTSDHTLLTAALGRITTGLHSRLDLGVQRATDLLTGPDHRAGNLRAIAVLSDGRVNPVAPESAVQAGATAKRLGILVYVIGHGSSINLDVLLPLATDPRRYFETGDAEALKQIYRDLVVKVLCPPEIYWGKR